MQGEVRNRTKGYTDLFPTKGGANVFCTSCGANLAAGSAFCPACGTRLASSAAASAPIPPPAAGSAPPYAAVPAYGPAMDYATWGTRALGYIVDSLLVGVVVGVVYALAGGMMAAVAGLAGHHAAGGVCCLMLVLFPVASLAVGLYNRVYLVAQRGYSIGQGLVKVKVVDGSGRLISQQAALIRLLAHVGMSLIAFLGLIDLLWPLWDERRQTLHDKAVSCYVIHNPGA